eukprot:TRINITY_DN7860_c0_g3_i1.p1 TRINITY_DN7860_c0_g3~~TRINITY_DN7860_c0_g3_i1.p1  ORF type:complete len:321 (+),score=76.30 TRINITY_DN7860_c0_g3_i1:163-1125(+)
MEFFAVGFDLCVLGWMTVATAQLVYQQFTNITTQQTALIRRHLARTTTSPSASFASSASSVSSASSASASPYHSDPPSITSRIPHIQSRIPSSPSTTSASRHSFESPSSHSHHPRKPAVTRLRLYLESEDHGTVGRLLVLSAHTLRHRDLGWLKEQALVLFESDEMRELGGMSLEGTHLTMPDTTPLASIFTDSEHVLEVFERDPQITRYRFVLNYRYEFSTNDGSQTVSHAIMSFMTQHFVQRAEEENEENEGNIDEDDESALHRRLQLTESIQKRMKQDLDMETLCDVQGCFLSSVLHLSVSTVFRPFIQNHLYIAWP